MTQIIQPNYETPGFEKTDGGIYVDPRILDKAGLFERLNKYKKLIAGAGLVVCALAPTVLASDDISDKVDEPKIEGQFSTGFVTDYMARPGFNPVEDSMQTSAKFTIEDLTLLYWEFREVDGNPFEIDAGFNYNLLKKDVLKGKLNLGLGYQSWIYPQGDKHDHIIEGSLNYASDNGSINFHTTCTYLMPGSDADEGIMVHGTIALPEVIPKIQLVEVNPLVIVPTLQFSYLDNFYGADGFAHLTPGVNVGSKIVENDLCKVDINAFAKYQIGFQENDGIKDNGVFGFGVDLKLK